MFSQNFLPYLKFHLKVGNFFGITIINFDKCTNRFVISSSKKRKLFFRISILLHFLHVLVMFFHLCSGHLKTLKKLQGVVFFGMELVGLVLRWDWKIDFAPAQLINSFLKFEDHLLRGTRKFYK
jgi:hypothetical protein